ncbi:MAG: hypothetical protein GDA42_00935 [Ekhidna sp.]|nr:hypothetical protein [Ekhidna sp.]
MNVYQFHDDTTAIEAEQYRREGKLYTLITVDKDWQQAGSIWFNISYGSVRAISLSDGIRFFHKQLLTGDTVDNIPGIPKVGTKKAEKALKGLTLLEEIDVINEMKTSIF